MEKMNKDEIAFAVQPLLRLVENGDISVENASKMVAMYIISLYDIIDRGK